MRVYELAKQLDLTNKELLDKIRASGIDVKSHSSSLDDKVVRDLIAQSGKTGIAVETAEAKKEHAPKKAEEAKPAAKPVEEKIDARAIALQAIARAKAKREALQREQHEQVQHKAPEPQEIEIEAKKPKVHEPVAPPPTALPETKAAAPAAPAPAAPAPAAPTPAAAAPQTQPQPARPAAPAAPPVPPRTEAPRSVQPTPHVRPHVQLRGDQPRQGYDRPRQGSEQPRSGGYEQRQPGGAPHPGSQARTGGPGGGYEQRRPGGPTGGPRTGPPHPVRPLANRQNVELQQLPGLPRKKTVPARGRDNDDLVAPAIEVMKLRPTRRPLAAGKKTAPKDEETEKVAKKPAKGKEAPLGKKIRPGRFLNLDTIEEVVERPATGVPKKTLKVRSSVLLEGEHPRPRRAPIVIEPKVVKLYGDLTVGEFAEKMGVPASEVVMKAMGMGEMLTMNKVISSALAELLAEEFKVKVEIVPEGDEYDIEGLALEESAETELKARPPVVTVMGHVDHGKTTLLDSIRKTNVAGGEFGGITQHIGAYHVTTSRGDVVFLDTPGHEAFTAMRARGASVTDIVILIVAADDGLMPQTIEAINHAKAANVPIIVAINKIDLPSADIQRVKNSLMQYGLLGEDIGGETIICEVSAKAKTGIDHLLEMVLLQAEIMELHANYDSRAQGVVIESQIDPLRGTNATVLIQRGTLRIGDPFVCGNVSGRVRLMRDDSGREVDEAGPSWPVEILGLDGCPAVGEKFVVLESERQARQIAAVRDTRRRRKQQSEAMRPHVTLEGLSDFLNQTDKAKDLNLILKADVQGSVEAVSQSMLRLSGQKVTINILHSGVGAVTESDVQLAMASDAVIIGFNVRPDPTAAELAAQEKIEIKTYRVIYELIEELQAAMLGMLDKKYKEVSTGKAEVRQVFKISRIGNIAGCYVTSGTIARNDKMRLVRDGAIIHTGTIGSLRRVKDDVSSVQTGFECGITLADYQDIKEGDVIETYKLEEVAQAL